MRDEAKVELRVKKGSASICRDIRINGFEIPGVSHVSVTYDPRDVRRISLDIIPTDVIEVDEADWEHVHAFDSQDRCVCGAWAPTATGPGAPA